VNPFTWTRPADEAAAVTAGAPASARFIAGGTTLVDLMRLAVVRPDAIVDITALPLGLVEETGGGLKIGALVRNADLAYHPVVTSRYRVLSEALLAGASPQIRNQATTGGNVLQRTRCPYFRDAQEPACNKRAPGSGCAAIGGFTRSHAVLGTSEHCIASNPSDMNVAMAALDAVVHVRGAKGARTVPFVEFHVEPGDHPERETVLEPGELITHVELPASLPLSHYLKVRDRASFAFALASAAVALELDGSAIKKARVALGGVGTKPWRSHEAEVALVGQPAGPETFRRAADAALAGARTQPGNAFKVDLARRTLVRALAETAGGGR
jgi:xanthine dehydrogenase YagS FAD-binding subunit